MRKMQRQENIIPKTQFILIGKMTKTPQPSTMRKVYFRVFGQEYDAPERKQIPLPLSIAYEVATSARK